MPAPDYATLWNFPGNVAAAVKSILEADKTTLIGDDTHADADAFIFGPRENDAMPPDRIEITASDFTQATDQQVQAESNGEWFFCDFTGQITISIITPRAIPVAAAEHGNRVGRVAFLMQPRARAFTPDNLPYYEPTRVSLQTVPRAEQADDEDVDRTDIVVTFRLWILPSAFPAVVE